MAFDLVTAAGQVVGMRATIVGRERVAVPAGAFDCFRIELEPTGLLGALAGLKLGKLVMWHTAAAPHFWVKYEGPDGSPGLRHVVRELVRFETRGATVVPAQPAAAPGAETPAVGLDPADGPRGRRSAIPDGLGYVVLLAAVVFEIGVEATRLLMD
jgi:hypothetical protein